MRRAQFCGSSFHPSYCMHNGALYPQIGKHYVVAMTLPLLQFEITETAKVLSVVGDIGLKPTYAESNELPLDEAIAHLRAAIGRSGGSGWVFSADENVIEGQIERLEGIFHVRIALITLHKVTVSPAQRRDIALAIMSSATKGNVG